VTSPDNPYRLPAAVVPSVYRIHLTPDLDAATFRGRVEVDVEVVEPTATLTLNAIELDLAAATVTAAGRARRSGEPVLDATYETAAFTFDEPLPVGPATVEIAFTGVLNDQLHGFYRSSFVDDQGVTRTIATTQFEATDARRAFPCWDEPALKATFQVTLTVPSDLAAFSNSMAVADTDLGNGLRTVAFAPTMKMSSYLVAFVVGPFEATDPIDVDGVAVRVIYPLGKGRLTNWALEVAAHALRFFTEYFAIDYPGDKYDLIAIPDFAAGAMENLGLVTFRETDLLIDVERASHQQLERVTAVINHETAHMWFGDLVTMAWWEGIWLNEAFATFMESLCTDHFRPQWKKWVGFAPMRDHAMGVDALHSTRPIEYEVVSPADCRGMFDVLTYIKGSAVLRMLEQFVGPEVFRDGIRRYLVRHAYANAVTADLWRALEEASGQPVGSIMDTWILQGGFPLISCEDGTLTQTPFELTAPRGPSNIGHDWKVPVRSRTLGSSEVVVQLLDGPSAPLTCPGPAVVNAGGSGFFRTAYGSRELAALSERLDELDELERAGLFADTWAAILAGRSSVADLFTLAAGLGELDEPSAWGVVAQAVGTLNRLVDDEGREALAAAVRALFGPQLARLAWSPARGESEQAAQLRALSIELLGVVGQEPAVIAEALRRFDAGDVVGDLATPIARVTAHQDRDGDVEVFERRRREAPTPQEEQLYLFAPAANPNPQRARALFERCFTDVRTQDGAYVIAALIANRVSGPEIWRAFSERLDEAVARFPATGPSAAAASVATLIADPALAREIREFHTTHPLAMGQRQVLQALERMDVGVAFAQRVRDTLTAQLRAVLRGATR
jgi:puromycin-sensitive aminopeptidase